jgi:hypothetical protein
MAAWPDAVAPRDRSNPNEREAGPGYIHVNAIAQV